MCWKWVSLDREHDVDERWAGVSAADEAALEVALSIDDARDDCDVEVICLGPRRCRRRAARRARRRSHLSHDGSMPLPNSTAAPSPTALADHLHDADLVLCGDYSIDRGTGSVPAFLAAELGVAQALGLVEIDVDDPDERCRCASFAASMAGGAKCSTSPLPAVLSVEGSVARLRRAPLAASLASRDEHDHRGCRPARSARRGRSPPVPTPSSDPSGADR